MNIENESLQKRGCKQQKDDLHLEIMKELDENPCLTIKCHKNCVSSYTSSSHIRSYLKRQKQDDTPQELRSCLPKRSRRSELSSFDFKQHCLFCGEICSISPDPRHPDRWRKARLCRTAERAGNKTFKEVILDVCKTRKDEWARKVEILIQAAVSDLHAADDRYHENCRTSFMAKRSIESACSSATGFNKTVDKAFNVVLEKMNEDVKRVWTSFEVSNLYQSPGGTVLNRPALVKKLSDVLGNDLLVLSGKGIANVLVFRGTATSLLRVVDDEVDDMSVSNVAKQIVKETKSYASKSEEYDIRIDNESSAEMISPTLLSLLSLVSKNLNGTLAAIMVGNVISGAVTNKATTLQIPLAVLARKKALVETLHDFGVTCTYDELQDLKLLRLQQLPSRQTARHI